MPDLVPELFIDVLLWFGALGCGLLGGVYFAFSAFIMTALARIDAGSGIRVMNSINSTIVRTMFMPFFLGTTLASAVLAVMGLLRSGDAESPAMIAGGVIYCFGMFVCTMVFNVPLNTELASLDAAARDAVSVWPRYLKSWTLWNHVRTLSSAAASALYIAAIAAR
jgi:uncharacterized membrane protein